jgi:DNA-binding NarL/FixJ family response regulator
MVRVALLDDHPAIRAGVEAIIASEPGMELVGSVADEEGLWPLLHGTRPDVLLLDLHHPALILHVRRSAVHPISLVLYSAATPELLLVAGVVAGADAVVDKSAPPDALVDVIRKPRALHQISPRMRRDAAARLDPAIFAMRLARVSPCDIAETLRLPVESVRRRVAAIVTALAGAAPQVA